MLLIYNGITLPFVKTDQFGQEVQYDSTFYRCTKITVAITSTITKQAALKIVQPGESWTAALQRIRHMLETPRQRLQVWFDDPASNGPYIDSDGNSDVQNGPLPESVPDFIEISGTTGVVIQLKISTWRVDCPGQDPSQAPSWLNHVWEESAEIDSEFKTTRTRKGTLRIRPSFGVTADGFRYVVSPKIPAGFMRESSHYQIQEDGLALGYTFVDKEVYAVPPAPAIKAEGHFRVLSTNYGARLFAEIEIRLTGHVKTRKDKLLQVAISVALDRVDRAGPDRGTRGTGGRLFTTSVFSEDLYENKVTVNMRCMLKTRKPTAVSQSIGQAIGSAVSGSTLTGAIIQLFSGPSAPKPGQDVPTGTDTLPKALLAMGWDKKPLYSDPATNPPPDPGLRSTAGLLLVSAALNDPCLSYTINELQAAPQGTTGNPPGSVTELKGGTPFPLPMPPGVPPLPPKPTSPPPPPPAGPNLNGPLASVLNTDASLVNTTIPATVSLVPTLDTIIAPPSGTDDSLSGGVYTDYRIWLTYRRHTNMAASTEMIPNGKTIYTKLAGDRWELEVKWTASRAGTPPVPPAYDLGDPNAVLIDEADLDPGTIGDNMDTDGNAIVHVASGVYVYGFKDPTLVKPSAAVLPWMAELMGLAAKPIISGGPVVVDPSNPTLDGKAALQSWLKSQSPSSPAGSSPPTTP